VQRNIHTVQSNESCEAWRLNKCNNGNSTVSLCDTMYFCRWVL